MYDVSLGDAADVMGSWPDNSADAIVTDPPSGRNMMVPFGGGDSRYLGWDSPTNRTRANFQTHHRTHLAMRPGFEKQVYPVLEQCSRVLKPGGYGVFWGFQSSLHWLMEGLERAGLPTIDILIRRLHRRRPKSPLVDGGLSTQLVQETELWVLARKPGTQQSSKANHEQWGVGYMQVGEPRLSHLFEGFPVSKHKHDHPAEKTVGWMRQLVRVVCPPGGVVVDPFCGSGTTGEAAILEGMSFRGVDRDPHWTGVAESRLQDVSEDEGAFQVLGGCSPMRSP